MPDRKKSKTKAKANTKDKRLLSIKELLTTERQYVEDVYSIITNYLEPAYEANLANFGPSEISYLFSNIEDCYDVACRFLEDLEEWQPAIGGLFLDFAAELEVYMTYCAEFEQSMQYLVSLKADPEVEKWLKQQQEISGQALGLDSQLLKPVQRMLRYPLLLKAIKKYTPSDNSDYSSLESAIAVIEGLCASIDNLKDSQDSIEKTLKTIEGIDGKYQEFGYLILDVDVSEEEDHTAEGKSRKTLRKKKRHIFLFEDFMVVTKANGTFATCPYLFRYRYAIGNLTIKEMTGKSWSCYDSKTKKSVIYTHDSEGAMKKVFDQLTNMIKKCDFSDTVSLRSDSVLPPSSEDSFSEDKTGLLFNLKGKLTREEGTLKALKQLLTTYESNPAFGSTDAVQNISSQVQKQQEEIITLQTKINDLSNEVGDVNQYDYVNQRVEEVMELQETAHAEEWAVALYDFDAEDESEMSLTQGEYVLVLAKDDDEWWTVSVDDSYFGKVPASYLEIYSEGEDYKYEEEAAAPSIPERQVVEEKMDENKLDLLQRRETATTTLTGFEEILAVYQVSPHASPIVLAQLEEKQDRTYNYIVSLNECIRDYDETGTYTLPEEELLDVPDLNLIIAEAHERQLEKERQKLQRQQEQIERQARELQRKIEREGQQKLEEERLMNEETLRQQKEEADLAIQQAQEEIVKQREQQTKQLEIEREQARLEAEEEAQVREAEIQSQLEDSRKKIKDMEVSISKDLEDAFAEIAQERAVSEEEKKKAAKLLEREKERATAEIRQKEKELAEQLEIERQVAEENKRKLELDVQANLEKARQEVVKEQEALKKKMELEFEQKQKQLRQQELNIEDKLAKEKEIQRQNQAILAQKQELERRREERENKKRAEIKKQKDLEAKNLQIQKERKKFLADREKRIKEENKKKREAMESRREEMDITKQLSSTIQISSGRSNTRDTRLKHDKAKMMLESTRIRQEKRHQQQEQREYKHRGNKDLQTRQQLRAKRIQEQREERNANENSNLQARRMRDARELDARAGASRSNSHSTQQENSGTKVPARASKSTLPGQQRHEKIADYSMTVTSSKDLIKTTPSVPSRKSKQAAQSADAPILPPRRKK